MHVRCDSVLMSRDSVLIVSETAIASSGLSIEESSLLNIASQPKAIHSPNPVRAQIARRYSHGKTLTGRTILSIASKLRRPLAGTGEMTPQTRLVHAKSVSVGVTSCARSVIKDREVVPKGTKRTLITNTGLPKGVNSYGNGVVIVPTKGRTIVSLLFRRTYVSGRDNDH